MPGYGLVELPLGTRDRPRHTAQAHAGKEASGQETRKE
jgi:hypothetical protein